MSKIINSEIYAKIDELNEVIENEYEKLRIKYKV